ncbi:MAG: sigma-54-dependent Fis family transcriptional regulator [Desulfobulbaceae bacterium]|nr:sigma-54-dependent Fis family transcriptional regulator [Desulfobulbaceae bacterium]
MTATVLIVDDEKSIRKALGMILAKNYHVWAAKDGPEAMEICQKEKPDAVLLDVGLPGIDGMEVLRRVKKEDPDVMIVMVTAVEDVKIVVEAVKLGAYDYLVKPINAQEVLLTLQNALENKQLKDRIRLIQKPNVDRYKFDLIGRSAQAESMIEMAGKVSKSIDTPVLIVGETGAGKGVLARIIHYSTDPESGPFVTVNCGAIAKDLVESELFGYERGAFTGAVTEGKKGRFEEAAGGTLLLDEIGAMPLSAQVKLLGVLEERSFNRVGGSKAIPVSSRIIAATNTDLENAVEQGLFRIDLFYRLNVVKIEVPPLRERADDIIVLAEHFMGEFNQKLGKQFHDISSEAKEIMLKYNWPGNVRELRNVIERIILLEEGPSLLPEYLSLSAVPIKDNGFEIDLPGHGIDYEEVVNSLVKKALKKSGGNVLKAARFLNMPDHKLRYRIKKFNLK